ncbi:MAG: glnQ [Myxococcaceae bacterium]|nr:glnQ [Myxococcaceae bacterium]
MPKSVIEIRSMHKNYGAGDTSIPVLKGVDFSIESGEIVALMGPSGSGKSTLLNILGCLDRPTSGKYLLGGRDVSTLSRSEQAWVRLHFLGFIFQSFHLLSDSTVLENVAMPLFYAGIGREEREARALKLIDRVGLKTRVEHRPSELSGGQRQRVAIARSLVNNPKVLLADEPTGALDTPTGIEVLKLLRELHDESGLTMLLVTHDQDVADTAFRTIYVRDGHIVDRAEVVHASAAP